MIIDIVLLVVGLLGLGVTIKFWVIRNQVKKNINQTTYSRSVNRARVESGIYIEHGMVNDKMNLNVQPECKLSNSFFESIH